MMIMLNKLKKCSLNQFKSNLYHFIISNLPQILPSSDEMLHSPSYKCKMYYHLVTIIQPLKQRGQYVECIIKFESLRHDHMLITVNIHVSKKIISDQIIKKLHLYFKFYKADFNVVRSSRSLLI